MTGVKKKIYSPDKDRAGVYAELYPLYKQLHDAFGTSGARSDTLGRVMKELIAIRSRVRKG
jgi:L-ribulokinase